MGITAVKEPSGFQAWPEGSGRMAMWRYSGWSCAGSGQSDRSPSLNAPISSSGGGALGAINAEAVASAKDGPCVGHCGFFGGGGPYEDGPGRDGPASWGRSP